MNAWFEQDAERFNREIKELKDAGVKVEIDQKLMAQGILRLQLFIEGNNPLFDLPSGTPDLELTVVFPYSYPYFRPVAFGDGITLQRHYNPVGKNFCLLGRQTDEWEPRTTLAQHIRCQLKKAFIQGAVTDPEILIKDPTEQPEPISEYYSDRLPKVLFAPDRFETEKDETPVFKKLGTITVGISDSLSNLRFAVLQSKNERGEVIDTQPEALERTFDQRISGAVYRLPDPPPFDPSEAYKYLKQLSAMSGTKQLYQGNDRHLRNGILVQYVFALNFPEEGPQFKKEYTGWLFLIILRDNRKGVGNKNKWSNVFFAKLSRLNQASLNLRVPKLKPLTQKTVAVFGAGALGAPSAIEFAKSGVKELRLLDFDSIELGTTVRWPFGVAVASLPKTQVLASFIEQNYPFTKVVIENIKIGDIPVFGNVDPDSALINESDALERMLTDVSLVYDATADYGLMHFLSRQARSKGVPYVSVSATEGAVGGRIMRVIPGQTEGCWMCMRYHESDGSIPQPPADSSGRIQPIGCGDVTFTGTSFDLLNLVSAGVRLAVSTLCHGAQGGYPPLAWDIGILHLKDETGNAVLPRWDQLPLKRHPECPYCNHHEQ